MPAFSANDFEIYDPSDPTKRFVLVLSGLSSGVKRITGVPSIDGALSVEQWVYVKLASDFVTSSAADTNVTGLNFTPAANKTYHVTGMFAIKTASILVGARPGIAWPSGMDWNIGRIEAPSSITTSAVRFFGGEATGNAPSLGLPDTTNEWWSGLDASFDTGASPSGTFQVTLASSLALTNVTMLAGSWIAYREI